MQAYVDGGQWSAISALRFFSSRLLRAADAAGESGGARAAAADAVKAGAAAGLFGVGRRRV